MEHHVVRHPAVEVQFAGEAVFEHGEVGTDVPLGHHLPHQVVLIYRLGADSVVQSVAEYGGSAHTRGGGDAHVVGGHVVVTQHTPAGAQLQEVEIADTLHEVFVGDVPTQTHGREEAPLLLILGAAVCAEGHGSKVFFLIVVSTSGKEGQAVVTGCSVTYALVLVGAVAQIHCLSVIIRNVSHDTCHRACVLHPGGLSQHGGERMGADPVVITQGVIQNLIGAVAISLGQAGYGRALGATYIVFGSVGLGVVEIQVEVVTGLELKLLGNDGGLGVCGEHRLVALFPAVIVVCSCGRIAVGVAVAVKLRGVELHGVGVCVGIVVNAIDRRVHESLIVHAGIGIALVVAGHHRVESHLEP